MVDQTLLPANATPMERAVSATFQRISAMAVPIRAVKDPAICPLPLLPWLAWERRVPEWDAGWSEVQKRIVVASSYDLHRHAGTRWAVVKAISQLGFNVQHQCWFEYGDTHSRFRLVVTLGPVQAWTNDNDASLVRVALRAKGAHDRLAQLALVRQSPPGAFCVASALLIEEHVTLIGTTDASAALPPARLAFAAMIQMIEHIQISGAA